MTGTGDIFREDMIGCVYGDSASSSGLKFSALFCSCHKNLVPFTQNNSLPRLRNKDTEKKVSTVLTQKISLPTIFFWL